MYKGLIEILRANKDDALFDDPAFAPQKLEITSQSEMDPEMDQEVDQAVRSFDSKVWNAKVSLFKSPEKCLPEVR